MDKLSQTSVSRNTDPVSSHMAEDDINNGNRVKQADIAYKAVLDHPGHTSYELVEFCSLDRYQLARRLSDLERMSPKMVRQGTMRACKTSGKQAVTWYVNTLKVSQNGSEGNLVQVAQPCEVCGSYYQRNGACNICKSQK